MYTVSCVERKRLNIETRCLQHTEWDCVSENKSVYNVVVI